MKIDQRKAPRMSMLKGNLFDTQNSFKQRRLEVKCVRMNRRTLLWFKFRMNKFWSKFFLDFSMRWTQ